MPKEESRRPVLCTVRPKAGRQSVRKVDDLYCSLFTTPGTDRRKTGIIVVGHHTGSNQILVVGTTLPCSQPPIQLFIAGKTQG